MSKIVIIGANHAGTAAANTVLDNYPDNEVVIFDRNSNISYLGCGTALWIGKQIDGSEGLFYSSPEALRDKGATVYMETEVNNVDFASKTLYATSKNGEKTEEKYDKIIIGTGSLPLKPNVDGLDKKNVESVKLFQNAIAINDALADDSIKDVSVIGAGYIGVEIAEAARRRGKNVRLIETKAQCLSGYYDKWFTDDMNKVLSDQGIEVHYNETLTKINGDDKVTSIVTDKGEYSTDFLVLSIGFKPNSPLGGDDIKRTKNGAYAINRKQETSVKDVYAIGDCAVVYNNAKEDYDYIALATNAVRSGILAGHNASGTALESVGVQGSNGISIYKYNMVSTGLTVEMAKEAGFDILYTDYEDLQKPGFMKDDNNNVKIRIVYEKKTRRVLGAQIASYNDISMLIHMFSLAIDEHVTIDKLKLLDIFFLPHFNQPYNYITMAALTAE